MPGEFNRFFRKESTTSRVSHNTSCVLQPLPKRLKTEQNTVKASLFDDYIFKHYLVQMKSVQITRSLI